MRYFFFFGDIIRTKKKKHEEKKRRYIMVFFLSCANARFAQKTRERWASAKKFGAVKRELARERALNRCFIDSTRGYSFNLISYMYTHSAF